MRSFITPTRRALAFPISPRISHNLVRFNSSKKSDNVPSDASSPTKLPIPDKLNASVDVQKAKSAGEPERKDTTNNSLDKYLSFDELPKVPQAEVDRVVSINQLYSYQPRNIFDPEEESKPETFAYNFSMLPSDVNYPRRYSAVDVWHEVNGQSPDHTIKVHPLKRSITGKFERSTLLNEVSDFYLWDMFPQEDSFGAAPFDGDKTIDSVKNYEKKHNDLLKKKFDEEMAKSKELENFRNEINAAKSFVKKKYSTDEDTTVGQPRGRKKFDRELYKKYLKLVQGSRDKN